MEQDQFMTKDDGVFEQEDLKYFEASEDADEEFYAGGGQFRRHGLEHFPQLWCANGTYSVYGQVCKPRSWPYIPFVSECICDSTSILKAMLSSVRWKTCNPCMSDFVV